uniref:Chitin binding domain-containing protein n=1 Tax=Pinctada fucata TaxID=50426 RepID=A0A3G2LJ45_PINFU|nr:chitin binding domain-containing protein [Pinctada fucata]
MNGVTWTVVLFIIGACVSADEVYEKFEDGPKHCKAALVYGGWAYSRMKGSCNQFIQCTERDQAFIQTCAAGTFYNGKECRHAREVNCPYDPCSVQKKGFKYSDGQSCFGYYRCVQGRSFYKTCKNGYYFNPYKQGCYGDPTCKRDNLIHPCAFGTTYPFPGKPRLFYLFDGLETFTPMRCPRGTWYRHDICTCDWITPGKIKDSVCSTMFHFMYDGNFLEKYNRIQQMPTTGVAIFGKSALFNKGGKIIIWAMNNLDLDNDFALCFEFQVKTMNGEVSLLSNDYDKVSFTYKLTYIPLKRKVRAYVILKDGTLADLTVIGVDPNKPHFVRLAKFGDDIKLRVDNTPAAVVKAHAGVAPNKSPLVIGAARGSHDFIGYFDELKFFRCVPSHFFDDYHDDERK